MVTVAAVALGSSTYAWFATQNTVTAEGMSVKAQAESGIVIKSVDADTTWATTASAGMEQAAELKPTTTSSLTQWYHAVSDDRDNAKAGQASSSYTEVTDTATDYMLKKTFAIRSASDAEVTGVNLGVKSIEVKAPSQPASSDLNKALRIGVKLKGSANPVYIFAPYHDFQSSATSEAHTMNYANSTSVTWYKEASANTNLFTLTDNKIGATDDNPLIVEVYIWFEGEDPACKSTNVKATLDELGVTVQFEAVSNTSQV